MMEQKGLSSHTEVAEDRLFCPTCKKCLDDGRSQTIQEGMIPSIAYSQEIHDGKSLQWENAHSITVHDACCLRYLRSQLHSEFEDFPESDSSVPSQSSGKIFFQQLRSISNISANDDVHDYTADSFDFTDSCFICARTFDPRKRNKRVITKDYMKERILEACRYQKNGDLSKLIASRISHIPSLVAVKAKYHSSCYNSLTYIPAGNEGGAHQCPDTEEAFAAVCEYIESNPEKILTLAELESKMGNFKLAAKTLFKKLQNHYGDDINISSPTGHDTLISYKCGYFTRLFSEFNCGNVRLSEKDKRAIIDTAASLIRSEIMVKQYDSQKYPVSQNFLSNVVSDIPSLLKRFMRKVITSDTANIKRESIAHTIISAVKPRGFCSTLLLSVGTYIHRKTGSKIVIDVLDRLGFCSSYYNTQTYEASTISNSAGIQVDADAFSQFVFDSTAHNVQTLDGQKSFHCLGGIAVYTPGEDVTFQDDVVRCLKPTASQISEKGSVKIIPLCKRNDNSPEQQLCFENVNSLQIRSSAYFPNAYAAYLWAKYYKRVMKNPTHSEVFDGVQETDIPNIPSWRGFMEVLSTAETYEISKVICLPCISTPPSELPTLNTALYMAAQKCEQNKQKHCFVTFNQPLYIEARKLVASDSNLSNVIVRLGGCQMLMSYFGAISNIMNGSGLEELWSEIYAPLSVKQMMAGEAFGRAIRAHILTFTALGLLIIEKADSRFDPYYVAEIIDLMKDWNSEHSNQKATLGDCDSNTLNNMTEQFASSIEKLKKLGPTSELWIQYFEAVTVALQFYEAERSGNWSLHLQSVKKMLPLFHASGHHNYAKCAQIYLQDMSKLKNIMHPVEFKKFTDRGYFTIRRSDKPFCGVGSDMTFEQTFNQSFSTSLKHGQWPTDNVLTRFYASMPSAFNIIEGLEDYVNVKTCYGEQHLELTLRRIKRDIEDIDKLIAWLEENPPFVKNSRLISLANGLIADTEFYHCHRAVEEGLKAMECLEGKHYDNATMNLTHKVKSLSHAIVNLRIQTPTSLSIDPYCIFQKVVTVLQGQSNLKQHAFEHELSAFPLSLFDKNGIMRQATKSELWSCFCTTMEPLINQYVIDGDNLLFTRGFTSGTTFETICQRYLEYVIINYGPNCVVVFNSHIRGYIGTKSYERISKRRRVCGPTVDFTLEMKCTVSSSKFFENYTSKGNLVRLLIAYFRKNNIRTIEALDNADALIVHTAIDLAATGFQCAVVGNNIDLLVLCVGLASDPIELFFCKNEVNSKGEVSHIFYSSRENARLKKYILLAHAFSGCDATSAFYNKGKKEIMKVFEENQSLRDDARFFNEPDQDPEDLMYVARRVIYRLYNATEETHSLSQLRYELFENSAIFGGNKIKLADLPPSDEALFQHVKRVYHQIQAWLGKILRAESWGWVPTATMLLPQMTDIDPAPISLMIHISCSCAEGCKSSYCTCIKAGLRCWRLCKGCHGETCVPENPRFVFHDVDNDLDDEDNYRKNDSVDSDMSEADSLCITSNYLIKKRRGVKGHPYGTKFLSIN